MGKSNKKENDKYGVHKEKLKKLFKGIYGLRTVDFREEEFEKEKSPVISLGIGTGLIHSFTLKTEQGSETKNYLNRLDKLFEYTFKDKTIQFEPPKNKDKQREIIKNTLIYFIGEEVISSILNKCVEDLPRRRYVPTDESIFEVMNNYERYQGVPMRCTSEKLIAFKDAYENQYDTDISDTPPDTEIINITFEEFCRKYQDVMERLGVSIYELLTYVMIPVFSKENVSEEKLDADYSRANERIKSELTKAFESEANGKISSSQETNHIKKIILVDRTCDIKEIAQKIWYYPECAPVLSDWNIPIHRYKKYYPPHYKINEINDVLIHPVRLNSLYSSVTDIQADEDTVDFPISKIKIPYTQSVFHDFQIQYWTSDGKYQSNTCFLVYNVDSYVRDEIIKRWSDDVEKHWVAVFDSIEDILQSIFSIDFLCLIKEISFEEQISQKKKLMENRSEKNELTEEDLVSKWLKIFNQQAALTLKNDTFSSLIQREMIIRHYFLQHVKSSGYIDVFGEDYITHVTMKQIAYVYISLIGEFVTKLKKCTYNIVGAIEEFITKKNFDSHMRILKKHIKSDKLNEAIEQWDKSYQLRRKSLLQEKRRSIRDGVTICPDDSMLGLMKYAEENGNLFLNLKNALEEYLYCLQKIG